MKRVMLAALFACLAVPNVKTQTWEDLRISISNVWLMTNGAETPVGSIGTGVVTIGQTTSLTVSMKGCGSFASFRGDTSFDQNITAGWKLEITPTRVTNGLVWFRLKWTRTSGVDSKAPTGSEDLELSLKPGQSRPLDLVAVVSTEKRAEPCRVKAAGLKVSVEYPYTDRRLIAADVWLVERLPDGKEQSQLQSVRGVPHKPIPFYFDSVSSGGQRFDFFGELVADLDMGRIKIELEMTRAVPYPESKDGYQAAHYFRSPIRLDPGETVEVELNEYVSSSISMPKPVPGHLFSLRIRAKQLR